MPDMNATYRNAVADYGASLITHIGLVNDLDAELAGGSYARKAVTWVAADGGLIRPNADILFDIPAGSTVAGWRGYSALTAGTEYGGKALTPEVFVGAGTYGLLAASTAIKHE